MNFEPQLQQWVAIDNQMRILSDRMKELRDKKTTITKQITSNVYKLLLIDQSTSFFSKFFLTASI